MSYWGLTDRRAAAAVGHAVAGLFAEGAGFTPEADVRSRFLGEGAPPAAVGAWRNQLRVASALKIVTLLGNPGDEDAELVARKPCGTDTQQREAAAAPALPAWPQARLPCLLVEPSKFAPLRPPAA